MIEKVLICGIGAVGRTIASKIDKNFNGELKIFADIERYEKYTKNKPLFNGQECIFQYLLPSDEYKPDLIIICVKSYGLKALITQIEKFIRPDVKIISLINGISSEEILAETFPEAKILKSYFIGHSAVKDGDNVTQDGIWQIVCERDSELIDFFKNSGINYTNPENIEYSMWLKYTLNLFSNQTSAILNMTFGELKNNTNFIKFAKEIIKEVRAVAVCKKISGLENLEKDALNSLNMMCDEGKTSMLQDILDNRKTEVDIFAGEIISLGKLYGIQTPYNQVLYDLIKIKEELNEYRIHSCQRGQ